MQHTVSKAACTQFCQPSSVPGLVNINDSLADIAARTNEPGCQAGNICQSSAGWNRWELTHLCWQNKRAASLQLIVQHRLYEILACSLQQSSSLAHQSLHPQTRGAAAVATVTAAGKSASSLSLSRQLLSLVIPHKSTQSARKSPQGHTCTQHPCLHPNIGSALTQQSK